MAKARRAEELGPTLGELSAFTGPFPIVLSGNTTGVVISGFVSGGVTNTGPSRVTLAKRPPQRPLLQPAPIVQSRAAARSVSSSAAFGSCHE